MSNPYELITDLCVLRDTLKTTLAERLSETNTGKQAELDSKIERIKAAIVANNDDKQSVKASDQERLIILREIKATVDQVPRFKAGNDVHLFLNQLSNVYEIHVKNQTGSGIENAFLRATKQRLNDASLTQLVNSGEAVDTWTQFKLYMVKTHEPKSTHFQRLGKLRNILPSSNGSWSELAARLENQGHECHTSLLAKYTMTHKGETEIPSKVMIDLYNCDLMLMHMQMSKTKNVYEKICNLLDDCWTPAEIANKADTIVDRIKYNDVTDVMDSFYNGRNGYGNDVNGRDSGNGGNGNSSGSAKNKNDKNKRKKATPSKDKDCWFHMDGKCRKGEQCGWRHEPAKFGIGRPNKNDQVESMVALSDYHFQN